MHSPERSEVSASRVGTVVDGISAETATRTVHTLSLFDTTLLIIILCYS